MTVLAAAGREAVATARRVVLDRDQRAFDQRYGARGAGPGEPTDPTGPDGDGVRPG